MKVNGFFKEIRINNKKQDIVKTEKVEHPTTQQQSDNPFLQPINPVPAPTATPRRRTVKTK